MEGRGRAPPVAITHEHITSFLEITTTPTEINEIIATSGTERSSRQCRVRGHSLLYRPFSSRRHTDISFRCSAASRNRAVSLRMALPRAAARQQRRLRRWRSGRRRTAARGARDECKRNDDNERSTSSAVPVGVSMSRHICRRAAIWEEMSKWMGLLN